MEQVVKIISSYSDPDKLKNELANKIFWDDNCQDLDVNKKWIFNRMLGFNDYTEFKTAVKPLETKCIGSNCNKPITIRDRKDKGINLCSYHLHWKKYNEYINSDSWKLKCQEVLRRDNYKCRGCGKDKNLTTHHITYEHLFNEPLEDLITFCKSCHDAISISIKNEKSGNSNNNTNNQNNNNINSNNNCNSVCNKSGNDACNSDCKKKAH